MDTWNRLKIISIFLLLACFLSCSAAAQTPEERRLHEIDRELSELEPMLAGELHPEDRERFQHRVEQLHRERQELEEFLGSRHGRIEHGANAWSWRDLDPAIVAAIIGALAAIIVALIGRSRGRSS